MLPLTGLVMLTVSLMEPTGKAPHDSTSTTSGATDLFAGV